MTIKSKTYSFTFTPIDGKGILFTVTTTEEDFFQAYDMAEAELHKSLFVNYKLSEVIDLIKNKKYHSTTEVTE